MKAATAVHGISDRSVTGHAASPRFYPQLDGMRAFAVAFVLLYHMIDLDLPHPLADIASAGWIGVDAFFVLSGFLITRILLSSQPRFRSFGLFVARRTLRTWPLYFVVLLLAYFVIRDDVSGEKTNWLEHLFFLQNYAPSFTARCLSPTWSLCVEEQFYVLWPLVVFCLPRRFLGWLLVCVFVALPVGRDWGLHHAIGLKRLFTETQFHLDGLTAGSFVALLTTWFGTRSRKMHRAAWAALILGAGATILGFWRGWAVQEGHNFVFGFTSLAISFSGLMLILLHGESSALIKLFSLSPLRYIGRISYGIYLIHEGVISLVAKIPLHHWLGTIAESWVLLIFLRVALSVGVAAISYRFFESPILRFKDRLR
jgi:peptidoglycan/LPS O-acetylase OafA/YrhL